MSATYRAVITHRQGKTIAISGSLRTILDYIRNTPHARRLTAVEYRSWLQDMPEQGGHPPVVDLDQVTEGADHGHNS